MLLNVTEILSSEGMVQEKQVCVDADMVKHRSGEFPIIRKAPVKLILSNRGKGKAHLEGDGQVTVLLRCDRCLKDVDYVFSFHFSRELASPDSPGTESEDSDDNILIGRQLDVDDLVYNEISVNWPTKILCSQDCKGLCRVCGADLNEGACTCDTYVPDPRMAVIKDIFDADKEV